MDNIDKRRIDELRDLLTEGEMFVVCTPGGLVSYCSASLRDLVDEDLKGRSLHYFIKDEDAARVILSAQTGKEADMDGRIGNKHFRCRMHPCRDKSFVIGFLPVSPEGSAFIRFATASLMQREIRDSLQVILAALTQMAPSPEASEQMSRAMIRRQSLKLLRLCDNMMDLARYQNGETELRVSELDLGALLLELQRQLQPLLEGSGVQLSVEVPEEPCPILGDREKLLRVMLNLICNSMQAAKGEPVSIAIRLFGQPDMYRISLRDSVPGHPDNLDWIQDKHINDDPFTGAALGGVGFGLGLVRAFSQLHGGGLVITAGPDGKLAFMLCLKSIQDRPASPLRSDWLCGPEDTEMILKELSPALELNQYIR
jgi:hypothetical protein